MWRYFLSAGLFLTNAISYGQEETEGRLIAGVEQAKNTQERIENLGRLSNFYHTFRADDKGDSVLKVQLLEAELSNDREIILHTLFSDVITNLPTFSSMETFDKAMEFLQKGLEYVQQTNQKEYEALAYIRKASLLRKRGRPEEAIQTAALAFPLTDKRNDSLKAVLYLELGDDYLDKGDAVAACQQFNSAYDIAYSLKSSTVLSETYHRYARMYQFLDNKTLAKQNLLESLRLNTKHYDEEGILKDYIDLAKLTDEKEYIEKAIARATDLNFLNYQLQGKRLMFYYLMVIEKKSQATLRYLFKNKDLETSFQNQGKYAYYWAIGNAYRYGNQPDSAMHYYLAVEKEVMTGFDNSNKYTTLKEIGTCYQSLNDFPKAIEYFKKALELSRQLKNTSNNASVTLGLSKLYAEAGEYQKAYDYNLQYDGYRDSLSMLSKERDIALLDIDRVNKQHATDQQDKEAEELRRHNLQYTGISLVTAFLFIILFVTGMFPVSKIAIRMLNFFSFICLFEFIILLIDNWLHDLTHGEPLRIWIAKIFIIALLLPLHHTLEHLVVKFLASPKLIEFRRRISLKKFWRPSKKTVIQIEKNLEESTLV